MQAALDVAAHVAGRRTSDPLENAWEGAEELLPRSAVSMIRDASWGIGVVA
jgi:hypothetical protein